MICWSPFCSKRFNRKGQTCNIPSPARCPFVGAVDEVHPAFVENLPDSQPCANSLGEREDLHGALRLCTALQKSYWIGRKRLVSWWLHSGSYKIERPPAMAAVSTAPFRQGLLL